jgi:hypothetical protein
MRGSIGDCRKSIFDIDVAAAFKKTRDFGPARAKFPEFDLQEEIFLAGPWTICEGWREIVVKTFAALARRAILHEGGDKGPICVTVRFNKLTEEGILTL